MESVPPMVWAPTPVSTTWPVPATVDATKAELLVKLPPTLSTAASPNDKTDPLFNVTARACWALLTVGWRTAPLGITTSLFDVGTWAGVQLAAVPQSVLTEPFQVMSVPASMKAARPVTLVPWPMVPRLVAAPLARLRLKSWSNDVRPAVASVFRASSARLVTVPGVLKMSKSAPSGAAALRPLVPWGTSTPLLGGLCR